MVEVSCRFDFYECYRHLCCFSRFYYPFRCSRFVEVRNGSCFSPKIPRRDVQREFAVKRRSG